MSPFDLAGLKGKLNELTKETEVQDFWNNPDRAQNILKKKKALENQIGRYERLESGFNDIPDLMELAIEMEDEEEADSIVKMFKELTEELEILNHI